jgi:hypothetical protein
LIVDLIDGVTDAIAHPEAQNPSPMAGALTLLIGGGGLPAVLPRGGRRSRTDPVVVHEL